MDHSKSETHLKEIAEQIKKLGDKIRITTTRLTGEKVDPTILRITGTGLLAGAAAMAPFPPTQPAALASGALGSLSLFGAELSAQTDETVSRVFTLNEALETFRQNQQDFERAAQKASRVLEDDNRTIVGRTNLKKEQDDASFENRAIVEGLLNAQANFSAKVGIFRPLSGEFIPNSQMAAEALRNLQATERTLQDIASIAKDPETRRLLAPSFDGLGQPLSDERIRPGFLRTGFLGGGAGDDRLLGGAGLDEAGDSLRSFSGLLEGLPGEFEAARQAAEDYGSETRSLNELIDRSNLQFNEQSGLLGALREQLPALGLEFPKVFDETNEQARELNGAIEALGISALESFGEAIFKGKEFSEVLKDLEALAKRLAKEILRIPDSGAPGGGGLFGGFFDRLFGSGGGGVPSVPASGDFFGGAGSGISNFGVGIFARGGVFDKGRSITALARGGALTNRILKRPTIFPLADGLGLAGEAGPEAVLPLTRLSDGRLGVGASLPRIPDLSPTAAAAPAPTVVVNQHFNISPGVPEAVRREVMALMPEIRRHAVDAILGAVGRGGRVTKAFGLR
jgi:hypothetical protein